MMLNGSERNAKKWPSTLEKRLTYISWTLLTVAVSLAMGILIVLRDKNSSNECLSPSCVHSAAMILQTIDATQSPCDNFYKFSCGNYLRESYLQNDKVCLDNHALLHQRIQEQLKIIIESPLSLGAPKPYHQLQKLYNLCMNTTAIEREGIKTAIDIINSVGSCPLLIGSRWNATNFHWSNLVYNLKRVGLNHDHFITLKVSVDERNSSYHILTIEPTQPNFATNSTLQSSVLKHLSKIIRNFGVNTTKSLVELKEVLDFAARLTNIYVSYHPTMNRSPFYNQMTLRELQYRFPKTDWMEYVTNIVSLPDVTFSYKEPIVVRVPQYLGDLEKLLENTPNEIQANYIIVRVLVSLISLLSRDLGMLVMENEEFVEGQPTWKKCIDVVQGSVGLPLLAMHEGKYFKNQDYEQVREIAFAVQEEFRAMLNENEWLDEITRQTAIDKLNAFSFHIGLLTLDDTLIANYYDKLEISSENYLKAMMSVNSVLQHMHYSCLRHLVGTVDWMDHTVLNKMDLIYSQTGNKLHIPGHILQGIFFNASRPRYLNYATVGSLIGSEITTGFGRQYDKHGNVNNWWGTKIEAVFLEKEECVASMLFNSIELRSQVEMLGLTGGLKQSYLAYMKWTKRNATEAPLAGLTYNQEQLFWISAAQLWCQKCGDNNLQNFAEYKVNEAFRNSINFSRDFKCSLGSPMNPTKKCNVW